MRRFLLVVLGLNAVLSYTISFRVGVTVTVIFLLYLIIPILKHGLKEKARKEKAAMITKFVSNTDNFHPTQQYSSPEVNSYIAIDEEHKKMCLIMIDSKSSKEPKIEGGVYSYKDILQSKIIEDIENVYSTGAHQLGNVMSATTTQRSYVESIDVIIVVNDTNKPFYLINFFTGSINRNNQIYNSFYEEATKWNSLISVIINTTDGQETDLYIADELSKLGDLLKQGTITHQEFDQQKKKLLS